MKLRRIFFSLAVLGAGYVAVAGCGDDESTTPENDAGIDAFVPDTSAPDTFVPDTAPPLDARSPEYTGSACTLATECYSDLDAATLKGLPACIDKVTNGYCTHTCEVDEDCCAVPGECRTGLKQTCASFTNSNVKYCFLSCEPADIAAAVDAGATDAGDGGVSGDGYCASNASSEFGCRSTGGGAGNKKACLPVGAPNDGGLDASDASDASDAPADAPDGG
jgi:hypothetical protein